MEILLGLAWWGEGVLVGGLGRSSTVGVKGDQWGSRASLAWRGAGAARLPSSGLQAGAHLVDGLQLHAVQAQLGLHLLLVHPARGLPAEEVLEAALGGRVQSEQDTGTGPLGRANWGQGGCLPMGAATPPALGPQLAMNTVA